MPLDGLLFSILQNAKSEKKINSGQPTIKSHGWVIFFSLIRNIYKIDYTVRMLSMHRPEQNILYKPFFTSCYQTETCTQTCLFHAVNGQFLWSKWVPYLISLLMRNRHVHPLLRLLSYLVTRTHARTQKSIVWEHTCFSFELTTGVSKGWTIDQRLDSEVWCPGN